MYKSPIDILYNQRTEIDGAIYRAVLDVGINVDKAELLKALEYDRDQYDKGFEDGKADSAVHALWLADEEMSMYNNCSNCRHTIFLTDYLRNEPPPYCEICGARMDGRG